MEHKIDRKNLTVIKGGGTYKKDSQHKFISAYVTDTRLMGVVGLYFHWEITEDGFASDWHQFFYFDAEEFGLENYQSLLGDDAFALSVMERSIIGGLGGKKIPLTEREGRFLVQDFISRTKQLKQPLPQGEEEYAFLLSDPQTLSAKELSVIAKKLCTPIESNFQLVHYYLMRSFGKDEQGLSYITYPGAFPEDLSEPRPATLCKNTIEEFVNPAGHISYLSESLIETGTQYKLVLSELTAENGLIKTARRRSSFSVTLPEVSMMLSRSEFITVFEILTNPDEFDAEFAVHTVGCLMTGHENGRLFLEFNPNNDHVNQQVFLLNDDIHCLYYVSDFGQLILAAYHLPFIKEAEHRLQKSPLSTFLLPTAKYEFQSPVLYDFIQSDFEDFDDFLASLQEE